MGDMVLIDEQIFTDIADAIRDRNGEETTYKPREMAEAVLSVYNLEDICNNAFTGSIVFTGTKLIGGLFYNNKNITSFIGNSITNAMGDLTSIGSTVRTFSNCTNLETVSMSSLKDLYHTDYIFSGCTKLKTCDMDWKNMTRLGTGVFQNCPALEITEFVLPKCTSNVYGYFITGNTYLTKFDIGGKASSVGNFAANAFQNCTNLNTVIIRDTTLRALANSSAFSGTQFGSNGNGGILYVPSSMVSSYESATNWSYLFGETYPKNSIVAIEGSQYENYYADGTAIT